MDYCPSVSGTAPYSKTLNDLFINAKNIFIDKHLCDIQLQGTGDLYMFRCITSNCVHAQRGCC